MCCGRAVRMLLDPVRDEVWPDVREVARTASRNLLLQEVLHDSAGIDHSCSDKAALGELIVAKALKKNFQRARSVNAQIGPHYLEQVPQNAVEAIPEFAPLQKVVPESPDYVWFDCLL